MTDGVSVTAVLSTIGTIAAVIIFAYIFMGPAEAAFLTLATLVVVAIIWLLLQTNGE
jgi:hypothetical protein